MARLHLQWVVVLLLLLLLLLVLARQQLSLRWKLRLDAYSSR
jgi:hypothetical protein